MLQNYLHSIKINYFLIVLFLFPFCVHSQYVFTNTNFPQVVSIHQNAQFVDVGLKKLSLKDVRNSKNYTFLSMKGKNTDFGFTNHHFWIKFQLHNASNQQLFYFLETARPITDLTELYRIDGKGIILKSKSGDAIPFKERSFDHRKTIFKITIKPNETLQFYLHVKSDGELLTLPLYLHTAENLIKETSFEQMIFGFFYGILAVAAILYLFFFFAMREKTFLYYSLYVVFIGLLQFSVDGYFFQFVTPKSGWFSLHSVIIFATIANFLLGRYAQVYLRIKNYSIRINTLFLVLYAFDFLLLIGLLFFPNVLDFSYPIANGLGLVLLLLIISSLVVIYIKTKKIDILFATGIFFLILGFVIFILKNFSILQLTFWTENSSKFGTGIEVIFLSLSMANLIRNLKNEREDLQSIALQRSEEMNELKSYYLSNISHELRTPLNAIINLNEVNSKEDVNDKIKKNCQIIKYSSQSLLSSVNDILDFSKIQKNELHLEETNFDCYKTLEHLKNNIQIQANDKGLDFQFSNKNQVQNLYTGDVVRLTQLVNNVLHNAVKFTSKGFVKFEIDTIKKSETTVQLILTISDSGVGIQKEKLESIYDSFSQNNINNKRKFGGLGLGLFIVKTLVDMKNGSISMESKEKEGTVCTIKLEYKLDPTIVNEIVDVETLKVYDLKGKNILCVEDNAINQMVIKMITKKWQNTTITYANNGQEGIDAIKKEKFDIVLMDLQMPIMDGYEATIAIRNGEAGIENSTIPIIAVTADVMESTKIRVKEIGMNRYLSKPLKNDILYDTVVTLVL